MGYGNNYPYFFYVLDGSITAPSLIFSAINHLDSVPNPNSVYTFRNCYASVSDTKVNSFDIYPNPTSGVINIAFNESIEESQLSILKLNGQTIYTDILISGHSYNLDTDFLAQGIYLMHITSDKSTYSTKLVKQ